MRRAVDMGCNRPRCSGLKKSLAPGTGLCPRVPGKARVALSHATGTAKRRFRRAGSAFASLASVWRGSGQACPEIRQDSLLGDPGAAKMRAPVDAGKTQGGEVKRARVSFLVKGGMSGLLLFSSAIAGPNVFAGESREQGPFSERNQFPFNLLFLAFPARGGSILPQGERELLAVEAYANTFAGSDILTSFNTGERERLTPSMLALAQSRLPGTSLFFVDTEQSRTALIYRVGALRRFELDVEVPLLSYRGGILDSAIEGYHRNNRLGNGGRENYQQDVVQVALTLGSDQYFAARSPSSLEIGDTLLTGRYSLVENHRGSLAVSAGLKLPTGSTADLGGSGSMDEGMELEGTLRQGKQRLHLIAGWVHPGKWALFPDFNPSDLVNFGVSYEFAHSGRISWIGQLQTQSSVFRGQRGSDGYLADYSTEILAGVKWQGVKRHCFFETAVIENIFNQNNGVDIGFMTSLGVRLRPAGS
ncbi:MAG: hypothetical protein DMH00_08065 [Acidobacteria bacterium]|nr:MAG: hypothetical protein DMH00_08065 [Acidobacteriota bacterium]